LFTAYGFFDTLFGKCYLKFDSHSGELLAIRGNPLGQVHYKGAAAGKVSVSRVPAGKSSGVQNVPLYSVVFVVDLDDAIVNYPLEVQSFTDEASTAKIAEWEQSLSLAKG